MMENFRMPIIFISYAHEDIIFAGAVQQLTDLIGYTSWRDKTRITGGRRFMDEIAKGIEDSLFFMPLFSPDYIKSEACCKELGYAQKEGKYIFPVVLDGTAPSHLRVIHQIRLKCADRSKVTASELALTIKELHSVIGDPDTARLKFPEGSDPSWPEEDLQLNLMNTRWSWCENPDTIGEDFIEFLPANRVRRSWPTPEKYGKWEVLRNGLVRFGPHILNVDLENGIFQGAHGSPTHSSPERSGRFLHKVTESGILD